MNKKKQVRAAFRRAVFRRDGYHCRWCGFQSHPSRVEDELDAHHITPRDLMPGGGYIVSNGISLCKTGPSPTCHERAEQAITSPEPEPGFSPAELYELIGVSPLTKGV